VYYAIFNRSGALSLFENETYGRLHAQLSKNNQYIQHLKMFKNEAVPIASPAVKIASLFKKWLLY
jgi:hypothetical protein